MSTPEPARSTAADLAALVESDAYARELAEQVLVTVYQVPHHALTEPDLAYAADAVRQDPVGALVLALRLPSPEGRDDLQADDAGRRYVRPLTPAELERHDD
ncbi:hypothetical protein [Oerskovia merdavium]|uniref:Uncharacterized protein n=1 Tax=Oerskovia merdavium TaxID=2762227 RepID=A0ABR8U4M8_9CELL|nr:hypothetical protein [Oerskovia merdavium]MBD7982744.1 hypothetical protein [Oerskovia merdavium]